MKISSYIPSGSGAGVVHSILAENIKNYNLNYYSPKLEYFPFLFPYVFTEFGRGDIIHTSPDYAFFVPKGRSKLVLTFHNYVLDSYMFQYSSFIQNIHYKTDLKLFTKLALEKADCVTAVSRFTADLVKKDLGYEGDIKVIYNGIDTSLFTPSRKSRNDKKVRVLFSGNLTKRKGADLLFDIASKLNDNIVIYYTSGLRNKNKLPSRENLHPLGRVEYKDMPDLYRSMDILLMPTVREGCSMSLLEAMACGLPVIASNCSSIPELIDDGFGGYLCNADDAEDFVPKLNMLALNPSIRIDMGNYNRVKAEEIFSHKLMVKNYERLFQEMAG